MDHAIVIHMHRVNARRFHRFGIGAAFVAQRVKARRDDIGFRQSGERGGFQRRDARVVAVRAFQVVIEKPHHAVTFEKITAGIRRVGARVHIRVGDGIDQQLKRDTRALFGLGDLRHDSGKIAARTVTRDSDACHVHAERAAIGLNPFDGRVAIINRGGKHMLGRKPIIDSHNHHTRFIRQRPAERIMRFKITDHPAATVEINQHRQRATARRDRCINAQGNIAVGPFNRPVLDLTDRHALQVQRRGNTAIHLAAIFHRHIHDARTSRCRHAVEQCLHLRV